MKGRVSHPWSSHTVRVFKGDSLSLSRSQVYRKNRVADLSAGPGAYLEGGMAALIAAGVGRSDDRPSSGGGGGDVKVKPDFAAGRKEEGTQRKSTPGVHGSATTPESQGAVKREGATKQEGSEQTVAKDEMSATAMDVDSRGDTGGSEGAGGAASAGTESASGMTTSDTSAGKDYERMPKSEGREEEGDGAGKAGQAEKTKMDGKGAGGGGGAGTGEGNIDGGMRESGKKYGERGSGTVEDEEAAIRRRQLLQQAQKMREQQQQLKEEREREEARRLARLKNGEQADGEHSEDEEDGYDEEGEEYDGEAGALVAAFRVFFVGGRRAVAAGQIATSKYKT